MENNRVSETQNETQNFKKNWKGLFNFSLPKFTRKVGQTRKLKKRYALIVTILTILLALGLISFFQYQGWLKDRQNIADYINNNTSIYNQTSQSGQQIVLSLNELVQFDQKDPEKIKEQLAAISKKNEEIKQVITQIQESKKSLQDEPNSEASDVHQKFINSLESKEATMQSLDSFLLYQTCLISASNEQTNSLDQFKTNIENFTNAKAETSLDDKLNFVNQAIEKINQNIKTNENLPSCFTGKFENYLSNKIRADLIADTNLYTQYISELNELSNGLRSTDSLKVQATTDKLVNLSQTPPSFYSSEQFKIAIEKPTNEIRAQADTLEEQEQFLSRSVDALKAKYLL